MYISATNGLGGAERSLLDTLIKMQDKINIMVLLPARGLLADKIEEIGIEVVIIPFEREYGIIGYADEATKGDIYITNYKAALQISEVIQERRIDLVDINSSVCCVGAMAAVLADVPYVWHIREFLEEDFGMELYDKELFEQLAKNADKLIAVSDSVKTVYEKKYELSLTRIYNGLHIDKYYTEVGKKGFADNNFILTGAINPGKGQFIAIKATQYLVHKENVNIKLFIVGSGNEGYIWALKKYIKENGLQQYVCMMPFCNNLCELRNSCSYSLTTSKFEALGRVTLEAMLAGNIVVGADTAGTSEIIGNEERGYLYKSGDEVSLAECMERAINESKEKKLEIALRAQKYVRDKFDSNCYIESLSEVYENAIRHATEMEKSKIADKLVDTYNSYLLKERKNNDTEIQPVNWKLRFDLLNKWLQIKQEGRGLYSYFDDCKEVRVGIYGLGSLGCRLYDELREGGICVKYIIDKQADMFKGIFNVKKPNAELVDIDILIITIPEQEENIKDLYRRGEHIQIMGIAELISSLYD